MAKEIKFYTTKGPYGFMSNFYRASFVCDEGLEWMTSEHFYQAHKATDREDFYKVYNAASPKEAARIGRSIEIRPGWDQYKYEIMKRALLFKFKQNPELMEKLLSTGDAILIEDTVGSPRPDPVWGNGVNGEGENNLGKLLMRLRDDNSSSGP